MDDAALAATLASLHDATLLDLEVDWVQARVVVFVRLHQRRARFTLENVSHIECPRAEPWGPSASINAARATAGGLEIEMQSGDTIRIVGELRDVADLAYAATGTRASSPRGP